jgi:hypothetical protein
MLLSSTGARMEPSRWQYPPPAFVIRLGVGVQPPNVCGVHRLPDHDELLACQPPGTRLQNIYSWDFMRRPGKHRPAPGTSTALRATGARRPNPMSRRHRLPRSERGSRCMAAGGRSNCRCGYSEVEIDSAIANGMAAENLPRGVDDDVSRACARPPLSMRSLRAAAQDGSRRSGREALPSAPASLAAPGPASPRRGAATEWLSPLRDRRVRRPRASRRPWANVTSLRVPQFPQGDRATS